MARIHPLVWMLAMLSVSWIALINSVPGASAQAFSNQKVDKMKICIDMEGTEITATLDDNAASRDFMSLLPMTLTLKDYASTEKVSDLPNRLSTQGDPGGYAPSVGDITYYAPWGNLAIFHKDFQYSSGLIRLGILDSGVELLRRPGEMKVTIRKADR